tara:strand:- start:1978 stop:2442 length:465 start_codon:yes stop_codon:yes gene_type:complete
MDQIWCGLGALETQKLTGICTIPKLADDVSRENLDFYLQDKSFADKKDIIFMNSKGFGGNNATSALISADLTAELLKRKHSQKDIDKWLAKKDSTVETRNANRSMAVNNEIEPIYEFDKDVLDITDLKITKDYIKTSTGFNYKLHSDLGDEDFS